MENIYTCNKCGKDIKVKKLKQGKCIDGKISMYFKCSKCRETYHLYYENDESLLLDEKMKRLSGIAFGMAKGSPEFKEAYAKVEAVKKKRSAIMARLNPNKR